jgi:type II secretory pathway component PulC
MAEVSERRDREVAPLVSVETVGKVLARPLFALNLFLTVISIFFSIRIGHALFTPDFQSPSRVARPSGAATPRDHGAVRNSPSSGVYDVIATRTLFHPNRSEPRSSEAMAPILPTPPTFALYGVAISDDTRVAFVQDLVTKQIVGYKTGDKLAGGQVERIEPDRVVIMRADGPIEVLLHQPKESPAVVPSAEEISPRRSRGRQE